jgi:LmbE family N-acetylglucosaminyl deacetylase
MCVLAHPDDESLGTGGTLAAYAAEGVATSLVTATRGERGRFGDGTQSPGPEVVGRTREAELHAAAKELGVRDVTCLHYPDGALDQVDPAEAIENIAGHLRRLTPQVVVTFGADGGYGHADHIAISQLTTAAIACAADPSFGGGRVPGAPHRVSKLYYIAWGAKQWAAYEAALRKLTVTVDGVERQAVPWPDWAITTSLDSRAVWRTVRRAVACHKTQMAIYSRFDALPEETQASVFGAQQFYRVFSTVNGGHAKETDLFEGLR